MCGEKIITKEEVIGKEVYTLEGKYLGKVKDLGITLMSGGSGEIYLFVETKEGKEASIPWKNVKAVGDIVLVQTPTKEEETVERRETISLKQATLVKEEPITPKPVEPKREYIIPRCPTCGKPLIYVPQYDKWYCRNCEKYVDLPPSILEHVPKCPTCGKPLSYIEEYQKWYCYNCNKYIL